MTNDIPDELLFSAAFPLPFRVFCLAGLGILGWATNLHGLHVLGLDPGTVLDLQRFNGRRPAALPHVRTGFKFFSHPQTVYAPVYRLFVAYSAFALSVWLLYRYATYRSLDTVDTFKFIPATAALCMLMVIVCPFNVIERQERDKFL